VAETQLLLGLLLGSAEQEQRQLLDALQHVID
jgi:hypothetical protein